VQQGGSAKIKRKPYPSISTEKTPMLQAPSFWEIMSDVPLIELLVRALRSEFSDKELYAYLSFLAKNKKIQDFVDSDNKASDLVRRWKKGEVNVISTKVLRGKMRNYLLLN
jgi:hypothetical protein